MDKRKSAFLAIAEKGSITHAAQQIGVAQSALTKTLQKIEHDVGARLFHRNLRGSTLPRSGHEYLTYCQRIHREYRSAKETVAAIERGPVDSISIGAGPFSHLTSLPKSFAVLLEEYPEIRLRCVVGNHSELLGPLLDGELDLALGRIRPEEDAETLTTIPLIEAETGIALRKGHPLSSRRIEIDELSLLREFDWIVYESELDSRQSLYGFFARHGIVQPRILVSTGSFSTGMALVAESDYLMSAPTQLAALLETFGLQILDAFEPLSKFESGIWIRPSSIRFSAVQRFIELMKSITLD